jgi:predicted nucleic acid-binding protein
LKRVVIDASIVLKWYLADEKYGHAALGLLEDYLSNEVDILAPSILEYEVVNGLIIAQKRGRIKEKMILQAVEGFMNLEISLRDLHLFYPKVLHYCQIFHRSAYDASYLALADEESVSLITADEGLYRAVEKELKWVKWLAGVKKT